MSVIGAFIAGARARAADIAGAAGAAMIDAAAAEMPEPPAAETPAGNSGPENVTLWPPRTLWAFFIRAWRPFCGWMIGLLLLRAVVVPIVQLIRGQAVEATDWTALAAMAGVLFVTRSFERAKGIA